uniref:Uncharacterized protein n=1 Tax=Solanum tuberosum TaxID=4113 RepID=M1DUE4_SOLTU
MCDCLGPIDEVSRTSPTVRRLTDIPSSRLHFSLLLGPTTVNLGDPNRDRQVIPRVALSPFISPISTCLDLHKHFWRPGYPTLKPSATRRIELLLVEVSPNLASSFCNFRQ